jgi:polygalacturonase
MHGLSRRRLLLGSLTSALGASAETVRAAGLQAPLNPAALLRRISRPVFRAQVYDVSSFGSVGDGKTNDRDAFIRAIGRCNADGGGRIVVPAGVYWLAGPLHLKSNVELHLKKDAVLRFSPEPAHYLPPVLTSWEGTETYNYSPLVYAYHATNVAITGAGTLDGNSKQTFATWKPHQSKDQLRLRQMGNDGVPVQERVFGKGTWLRPHMIQFFGCKNVLVEGVTILDAPFWVIHPFLCNNVTVRNVRIESFNPNNDGVDPESSVDVLIENCQMHTGDDSVAVKAGRDQDGWRIGQATENVVIRNCTMNSRHAALALGSEMSGGIRNVFMENCKLGVVERAVYAKANLDRGGSVERVWVRNLRIEDAQKGLLVFTTAYHGYRGNRYPPRFQDFLIENLKCKQATAAIDAVGVPESPLRNIVVRQVTVESATVPLRVEHAENFRLERVQVNGSTLHLP